MELVLGVDAGGSKTLAVVAEPGGRVTGVGRAGGANFQACGRAGARGQLARAVSAALSQAGAGSESIAAACFGVAGADRPRDFATIEAFTRDLVPAARYRLENDSLVALRAGTADGVGIALIAGTGSNAVGRNAAGEKLQVGGLGRLSGDWGSAWQLGEQAVVAAMMARDGRGPATALQQDICRRLGLDDILDVIEYDFYDHDGPPLDLGALAPLVFAAAGRGDEVAAEILRRAGARVARAAAVIADRLFPGRDDFPVVFGGAVFQRGSHPLLVDTVRQLLRNDYPGARFVRLRVAPVLGAVAWAADALGPPGGGEELVERLADSWPEAAAEEKQS
ncbi:MAG: ATPase [Deltaproteobacteria bacterium]|nr:MAG: ATPase [Deltaproteobacteria bacterium]